MRSDEGKDAPRAQRPRRRCADLRRRPPPSTAGCVGRVGHAGRRGFTLIEVLVALAIVAIGLASALRAVGSVAGGTGALHERLLAGWSADNRLAQLHLERAWPSLGTTTFACPQGTVALRCSQTVSATPNPLFRRVEVTVQSPDNGQSVLADLITVLANETNRPL